MLYSSLGPSPAPNLLASLDALLSFHPKLTTIRIYVSIYPMKELDSRHPTTIASKD